MLGILYRMSWKGCLIRSQLTITLNHRDWNITSDKSVRITNTKKGRFEGIRSPKGLMWFLALLLKSQKLRDLSLRYLGYLFLLFLNTANISQDYRIHKHIHRKIIAITMITVIILQSVWPLLSGTPSVLVLLRNEAIGRQIPGVVRFCIAELIVHMGMCVCTCILTPLHRHLISVIGKVIPHATAGSCRRLVRSKAMYMYYVPDASRCWNTVMRKSETINDVGCSLSDKIDRHRMNCSWFFANNSDL